MLATRETKAGARLAGASFVRVSVDHDGGDASALTALLGKLPVAPATLVYVRPGTLYLQMPGFNDKTTVQQAAHSALARTGRHERRTCARGSADRRRRRPRRRRQPPAPRERRPAVPSGAKELFVRHARKEGRSVAVLRAIDYGQECVVETEVYPPNAVTAVRAGPYTFADARQAVAFVTEAVEALMYLGCDIQAA